MPIKLTLSCITSGRGGLDAFGEHQHRRHSILQRASHGPFPMTDYEKTTAGRRGPGSGRRASFSETFARVLRAAAWVMRRGGASGSGEAGPGRKSDNPQVVAAGPEVLPHVGRLSDVVARAARNSLRAQKCHDSASVRVDAALYELEKLREELKAVVDPARLAPTAGSSAIAAAGGGGEGARAASEPAGVRAGPAGSKRSAA
jgi:hypothetical protein